MLNRTFQKARREETEIIFSLFFASVMFNSNIVHNFFNTYVEQFNTFLYNDDFLLLVLLLLLLNFCSVYVLRVHTDI